MLIRGFFVYISCRFLLRISSLVAESVSVKIVSNTLFDSYFNTNEESNVLTFSNGIFVASVPL